MSKLRLTLNQRELLIARHEQARKPLCSSRQRLPLEITSSFIGSACNIDSRYAGVRVRAGLRAHARRRDFRISRPTFRMHKPPYYLTRNAISDCMLRFAIRYCCLSLCLRLSCIRLINMRRIRKNSCHDWRLLESKFQKRNAKIFIL